MNVIRLHGKQYFLTHFLDAMLEVAKRPTAGIESAGQGTCKFTSQVERGRRANRRVPPFPYERTGVTLLEILFGAAIIAMAFLAILNAVQYGGKSTVKVNNYSKAMRLAQSLIEETRHVPIKVIEKDYLGLADDKWETLSDQYYPKSMVALNEFKSQLKELAWSGQLKLRKAKVPPGDQDVIKEVWVRVEANWTEGDETFKKVTRQVRLSNAIYNAESE